MSAQGHKQTFAKCLRTCAASKPRLANSLCMLSERKFLPLRAVLSEPGVPTYRYGWDRFRFKADFSAGQPEDHYYERHHHRTRSDRRRDARVRRSPTRRWKLRRARGAKKAGNYTLWYCTALNLSQVPKTENRAPISAIRGCANASPTPSLRCAKARPDHGRASS